MARPDLQPPKSWGHSTVATARADQGLHKRAAADHKALAYLSRGNRALRVKVENLPLVPADRLSDRLGAPNNIVHIDSPARCYS